MITSEELPSVFAKNLGEKCGLLITRERGTNPVEFNDKMERMRWFQQMAVTSKFEDCVAVYYGTELTDEQVGILKLIHRTTKPWMTGHVVGVLLEKLSNPRMANKDFAAAVQVLTEQLGEGDGAVTEKIKGILVKSTMTENKIRKTG